MRRLVKSAAAFGCLAALVLLGLLAALAGSDAWSQARMAAPPAATGASSAAGQIPGAYLTAFQTAGQRFGVPWPVLAGIYKLECDFGRSQLAGCRPGTENRAGAQGPGQFLAATWRRGLAPGQLIPPGPPSPSVADGYATDGDGDGVADPWDPADAVASTARLLAANGAAAGDMTGSVFAYNHDAGYVRQVLTLAAAYQAGGVGGTVTASAAGATGGVETVLTAAMAELGKPYQWGGAGPDTFDCSGLVTVVYRAAGIDLSHNAAVQYQQTAVRPVPLAAVQPGDLLFFGSAAATIHHVAIALGGGQMIDAPETGAVVRVEPDTWPDLFAATRPLG